MGGGNAQKSATARARNEAKKAKAGKGSQLAVNKAAQSIICQVRTIQHNLLYIQYVHVLCKRECYESVLSAFVNGRIYTRREAFSENCPEKGR